MTFGALHLRPLALEAMDVLKDALLAKGVPTLHKCMCKPEQSSAQLALEHPANFLLADGLLRSDRPTIWLMKNCSFCPSKWLLSI